MKRLKEKLGIGAIVLTLASPGIAALGFTACSPVAKQEQKIETLWGKPISVQVIGGHGYGYLSTVVENEKGEYVLCRTGHNWSMPKLSDLAALIDSEIKDGDDEFITIKGKYNGDMFRMESVSANGYTIQKKEKIE